MGKWYGSLNNRIEENRMFANEITVGMGMTEYFWSDRHAWEVIEVKDQKHVTVRELDHKPKGGSFSNDWELISNEDNRTMELTKRGKYWYSVSSITPEQAREIFYGEDVQAKIWASMNNFSLPDVIESGKTKRHYHRVNVSFGRADYYYDYSF